MFHTLSNLQSNGTSQGGRDGIAHLPMLVQDVAIETIGVRKALRACTLPDTDHTMLLGMKDSTLSDQTDRYSKGKRV